MTRLCRATGPIPVHWLTASMPHPLFCQLQSSRLISPSDGTVVEISADLLAELAESQSAETLIARDDTGAHWRLRRTSNTQTGFWLLQTLAESRREIVRIFRTALASKLANGLQHELRNPLNALGLQCDLLGRTVKPTATAEALTQAAGRVSQMKERLRDLLDRQNSMVGLWLSEPDKNSQVDFTMLIDEVVRLLRSYGSQREVRIQVGNASAIDSIPTPLNSIPIRLALLAVGTLGVDSAANRGKSDEAMPILIDVAAEATSDSMPCLQFSGPFDAGAIDPELGVADVDDWLATLQMMLDDSAIRLTQASRELIRIAFRS